MDRTELNKAIFQVISNTRKADAAKAHVIVSEAGYTITKRDGAYRVYNEATGKGVYVYYTKTRLVVIYRGTCEETRNVNFFRFDYVGYMSKEWNLEWKSLRIHNMNVSKLGIGQAKRRYERIKYYKENIAMYDGFIKEIREELARRQERLIERAMEKQKAVAVLEAYRKEIFGEVI